MPGPASTRSRGDSDHAQNGSRKTQERMKKAQRAAQLIKHVADPTRLNIVLMLAEGAQHVGAICTVLGQSQPAVSHHLSLLRVGEVIEARRAGQNNIYSLTELGEALASVVREVV